MTRVISGVLLGAVFLTLIWFASARVLLVVALGIATLAFLEYQELMKRIGPAVPRYPTLLATLAALAVVPFPYVAGEAVVVAGLIVIAISRMASLNTEARGFGASVQDVAAATMALIYLGLPLGTLVGVHIFGGRGAVLVLIGTIVVSDTAQYYSGRLAGRHPLAPRLSPKKTIEGAIGGFVAAPLFLYFAGPQLVPVANPLTIAAVGIAMVAAGIAGDLFESMLKRAANMKDSSTLIPGHGGVLDRIDAILFATPIFYVYLRWQYTA
jgi:phosphatidate cytidylyltransferase